MFPFPNMVVMIQKASFTISAMILIVAISGCASMKAMLAYQQAYNQSRLTLMEKDTAEYNNYLSLWRNYNKRTETTIRNMGLPDCVYPIRENCVYFAYCDPERYILTYPAGQEEVNQSEVPEELRRFIANRTQRILCERKKRTEESLRAKIGNREDYIARVRKEIEEVEAGKVSVPDGLNKDIYLSNLRQVLIKRNIDAIDRIIIFLYQSHARYEILNAIIRIRCGISPYHNRGNSNEANVAIGIALENKDIPLAKSLVTMMYPGSDGSCVTFALKKAVELNEDEFLRETILAGFDYDWREVYHVMIISKRYNDFLRSLIKDCYFDATYWDTVKITARNEDERRRKAGEWYNEKQFWLHEYHMPQGSIRISFIEDLLCNEELFCHYIKIPLIQSYFQRICLRGNQGQSIRTSVSAGNMTALRTILEESDYRFTYQDVQSAIESGSVDVLQLLRDAGVKFECDATTIYRAAKKKDMRYFGSIGKFGININAVSEISRYLDRHSVSTPVYGNAIAVAIRENDMETAQFLANNGVSINPSNGISPLAFAFDTRNYDAMDKLLLWGANPNCVIKGYSLMTLAVAGNKVQVVEMLLRHGVQINEKKRTISNSEVFAVEGNNIGFRESTQESISPLAAAIISKNTKISLMLLEKGANPNETLTSSTGGIATTINQISSILAITSPDAKRIDLLTIAIAYGMTDVARRMIENGANINGVPNTTPPLAWALCIGDFKIAELLVAKGAKTDFEIGNLSLRAIDAKQKIPPELRTKLGLQ